MEIRAIDGENISAISRQKAGQIRAALDEQGLTLMEYVKQTFSYQSDRVSKALAELTGREDDDA